jgi:hypothetical protein
MVVQAVLASAVRPVAAGWADGLAPAGVLVVGGYVPDRLVESNGIVFRSRSCQFDIKCGGSVMASRCGHSLLMLTSSG